MIEIVAYRVLNMPEAITTQMLATVPARHNNDVIL